MRILEAFGTFSGENPAYDYKAERQRNASKSARKSPSRSARRIGGDHRS
jgi:hypothetical protein